MRSIPEHREEPHEEPPPETEIRKRFPPLPEILPQRVQPQVQPLIPRRIRKRDQIAQILVSSCDCLCYSIFIFFQ